MKSIFESESAMMPFFDQDIEIETKTGPVLNQWSCRACVMDQGLCDPVIEYDSNTTSHQINFMVRKRECDSRLKIGDEVIYDGNRYGIFDIQSDHFISTLMTRD